MPEGAKGASERAKELAASLTTKEDGEVTVTSVVNDVTADTPIVLTNDDYIEGAIQEAENAGNKNLAKALKIFAENEAIKKASASVDQVKTPDGKIIMRHYRVLTEAITGASPKVEEANISTLTGIVTDADLDAAGVDKAWLLKIGSIEDLGYRDA